MDTNRGSSTTIILLVLLVIIVALSTFIIMGVLFIDNNANVEQTSYDYIDYIQDSDAEELNQLSVEQRIHEIVNEERADRGISEVDYDEDIREISRYKSNQMITEDYIAHTSPSGETVVDRFEMFEYNRCVMVGENLAQTYYDTNVNTNYDGSKIYLTEEELAQGVVNQFIESPDHKENLLNDDWDLQGIGFDIDDNKVYVTQKLCEV